MCKGLFLLEQKEMREQYDLKFLILLNGDLSKQETLATREQTGTKGFF